MIELILLIVFSIYWLYYLYGQVAIWIETKFFESFEVTHLIAALGSIGVGWFLWV